MQVHGWRIPTGDGVFSAVSIDSYKTSILNQWKTELYGRLIPNYLDDVRACKKLHGEDADEYDIAKWEEIDALKRYVAKDSADRKSLLTRAKEALDAEDYNLASDIQVELQAKREELRNLYLTYKNNLF